MNEHELLAAAQRGDQAAFGRLVEPHRRELLAHCYRMLGSVPDAEDALQDALLGAWRGLGAFEGRGSVRSWLYAVTTNACLKAVRRRPKRVLPIDYGPALDPHDRPAEPLVEAVWVDPVPDDNVFADTDAAGPAARYERRESVELAFIVALQHLPPRQRAVLILRDVLGFSAREAGKVLDTEPAAVDSALQRAQKTVDARLPAQSQQAALRSLDDAELRAIVDGYVEAWERADVDAVVAMLADDVTFAMPPQAAWYDGRKAVAAFLAARPLAADTRWRMVPTRANGQLAFGHYAWDGSGFAAHAIGLVALRGREIEELTIFRTPEALARFGLPSRLDG